MLDKYCNFSSVFIFLLKDNPKLLNSDAIKDNIALINTADVSPVIESAEVMTIREVLKPETNRESLEVSVTVAQLSTTVPIEVFFCFS